MIALPKKQSQKLIINYTKLLIRHIHNIQNPCIYEGFVVN